MKARRFYLLILLALGGCLPALAAETAEQWLAKARSYLGTESALNGVTSLHFVGSFEGTERVADPADAAKTVERPVKVEIDILFQKPMQHLQTLRSGKVERTTGLDNYDGWERVADRAKTGQTRLALLDAASIKRLRAATIENLTFYSRQGAEARQVELVGEATVDGVACVKLAFRHGANIVFIRSFDKATGRLVRTDIDNGGEIREEGEMFVNGIRFPRKVINKGAAGRITTISFDKVTVNEVFPADTFAVPSFVNP